MVLTKKLTDSVTPLPWRVQKRVLPQHTDHAGVMWHGAYVAWLEEARVEALCPCGSTIDMLFGMGTWSSWKASATVLLGSAGLGVARSFSRVSSWLMHRLNSSWGRAVACFGGCLINWNH